MDEEHYRNDVFPELWSLGTPHFATAKSDGTVVLSATGPGGNRNARQMRKLIEEQHRLMEKI